METNPRETDVEVMEKAALAYFERSTSEVKKIVHEFFDECDEDGNGKITLEEFLKYFKDDAEEEEMNVEEIEILFKRVETLKTLFKRIDTNGDGTLDFHEFLTFFFVSISESVVLCAGCANWLVNIHFTCYECHYLSSSNSYDLCADCYRRQDYVHPHSVFLDNHTLLRLYKSNRKGQSEDNSEVQRLGNDSTNVRYKQAEISNSVGQHSLVSTAVQNVNSKKYKLRRAHQLINAVGMGVQCVSMGVTVAHLCTTM